MDEQNVRRSRTGWLVAALVLVALTAGWTLAVAEESGQEFCEAWGAIPGGEIVSTEKGSVLAGEPISAREPCMGDDLWHYFSGDLEGIDGVMFDNCEISWVGGGRSTAAAEGIVCTPAPPRPPQASPYPVVGGD